jgi:ribosomal-protein-alanine N-acetyltransferase
MSPPPLTLSDVLVEGSRVRLRPVRPDDAPAAFPLVHGVRPVLDWLCWQGPRDLDDLREAYSTWRARTPTGDNYHLAVEALADGAFLGTASLRYADHPHIGDLGYWLGVPHHGRGYGTELVGLLVHIGFELMASTALSAEVFPGNAASVAVLERNGFRLARPARDAPASTCAAAAACGHPDPSRPRDQFLMLPGDRPPGRPRPSLVWYQR